MMRWLVQDQISKKFVRKGANLDIPAFTKDKKDAMAFNSHDECERICLSLPRLIIAEPYEDNG